MDAINVRRHCARMLLVLLMVLCVHWGAGALTINVVDPEGTAVSGFRWLVEEDTTHVVVPGALVNDSISLSIHNSYAPLVAKGHTDGSSVEALDFNGNPVAAGTRYFVSILPDSGYSISGDLVEATETTATVVVQPLPIPTAQISIRAFVDINPANGAWDEHDPPLGGCRVLIADEGGHMMFDAFGNMLGTMYNPDGSVAMEGTGNIFTLTKDDFDAGLNPYGVKAGEALVKNLAPGKYGIKLIPPGFDDNGVPMTWIQTTTIEGTQVIDAWVKANEPRLFVEGFGVGVNHADFGFVKLEPATPSPYKGVDYEVPPWNLLPDEESTGTITGTLRINHFSRPPNLQGYYAGMPVAEGWVALNKPVVTVMGAEPPPPPAPPGAAENFLVSTCLYVAPCDEDGNFTISNVPPGDYQLVTFDKPLDTLIGFRTVTVPEGPGTGGDLDLGNVLCFHWFGTLDSYVFYDEDQDGFRDPGEMGISDQLVNIRFRDGTIYQSFGTDMEGYAPFAEVFPFFKWLVVEVDFARFKATGMTAIVDHGGEVLPDAGWDWPSRDKLHPQPQAEENPNTLNNLSRTEMGPVLTQAMHLFLGQVNVIEWGKTDYAPGENGGISGIVHYATTRAENDPRMAVGEPWEPGVPRVQVNLYRDGDGEGGIQDVDGDGDVTLADRNNYPLDNFPGLEDDDWNGNNEFDLGDAINVVWTDSWDDNKPTGTIQDLPIIHGSPIQPGADSFGTWNQIRPGVFDGGYAFTSYFTTDPGTGDLIENEGLLPGTYVVEAVAPPGYEHVKEEDKNVDFGDEYMPAMKAGLILPPPCVGDERFIPLDTELSLFPGIPCEYAGQWRRMPDRKQVILSDMQNAAANFFLFTEVPKSARAVGFVNNDLGAEFNQASPNYGEKLTPSWLPISWHDWTGRELLRTYCDEFGGYNAMLPSTYTVNVASPSGVSQGMYTLILNNPVMPDGSIDPFYDPFYAITPWTFNYGPGRVSYLDTPIVPVAAFTTAEVRIDTGPADQSPVIAEVHGPEPGGGPVLDTNRLNGIIVTLIAAGPTEIRNPAYDPTVPGSEVIITRYYGFGDVWGTVTLNGVELTILSWNDDAIEVEVPAGLTTGNLEVTRGDNGHTTEIGVTLNIVDTTTTGIIHVPADYATIQAAIDAAVSGDIIVVEAGTYNENVIMWKPVRLQGVGAGSTFINGNPTPLERLDAWHARCDEFGAKEVAAFLLKDPFSENEAPVILVMGRTRFVGLTTGAQGGEAWWALGDEFAEPGTARIDGFTLSGSKAGGGIFAVAGCHYLEITNNRVANNQGGYAGGIAIGTQDSGFDAQNTHIVIRNNKIEQNGGLQGAGAISMNEYSDDYVVEENLIIGNFCRFNGAGISHRGVSRGENIIRRNEILFNENFFGAILAAAGDGGGIYIGGDVAGGTGSGNVTIDGNLIQGNLAGAGHGGGIRAFATNAQDILDAPDDPAAWYTLTICNNIIVNNVSALSGAGISLQDVAKAVIANNTIANNDCTSTGQLAFQAGSLDSTPQAAGIVSERHSGALIAAWAGNTLTQQFSNPTLVDNIVWENRSFYNDASLNGGAGGLAPNPASPYWDLHVTGSTTSGHAHLNPSSCVLTSRIDPVTGRDYGSGNVYASPQFLSPYVNALQSASVIDEGGNNVNVRFTPLTRDGSDYHIGGTSAALSAGKGIPGMYWMGALGWDFDMEPRPNGPPDIGADEYHGAGVTNSAPLALNDTFSVPGGSFNGTLVESPGVLANDVDRDGDTLTASLVTAPSHGFLLLDPNGSFLYFSMAFTGVDTFTYLVNDGAADSNVATVTLNVSNLQNNAPVAAADSYTLVPNSTLTVASPGVLANDTDPDGDSLLAVLVGNVQYGTLYFYPNGSFIYTPAPGFVGQDAFSYRVFNGLTSNTVNVVLDVTDPPAEPNVAPVPYAVPIRTLMNRVGVTRVYPMDANRNDAHTFELAVVPSNGSAVVTSAGVVSYTPNTDWMGMDSLTVLVTDLAGATGTVEIAVMVMEMGSEDQTSVNIQCPEDTDGVDTDGDGIVDNDYVCLRLGAGDGFVRMADGTPAYMFGFSDLSSMPAEHSFMTGMMAAEFTAPTLALKEGQHVFLNLTNVGMMMRPDLFDPHTVHFHGFPQAAAIFDGMPEASVAINMGATLTYYYQIVEPGTYMYHCHAEATEHMQMGMMGNIYVTPIQDGATHEYPPGSGRTYTKFAYNDGDGSTGYDVDYPLQMGAFDIEFHDASWDVQPLPFAMMKDDYAMLNGRSYPDTINPDPLTPPVENGGKASQKNSSLVRATQGQRILLRLSNLNVTRDFTLASGIPMQIVAHDAKLLRSSTGENLYYMTNSVLLGSGETRDAIIDTATVEPGTYVLYTTNLNYLSNYNEDFGGMMTEIVVE